MKEEKAKPEVTAEDQQIKRAPLPILKDVMARRREFNSVIGRRGR